MNISIDGKRYETKNCETIEDALKMCQYPSADSVFAVSVGGAVKSLADKIYDGDILETIKSGGDDGYRIYRQSIMLLLVAAVNRVCPEKELRARQSVNRSTFCEIPGEDITDKTINAIKEKMCEMADNRFSLTVNTVSKKDAIALFQKSGNTVAAESLAYSDGDTVRLFEDMGKYYSVYGVTVPHAGYLKEFDLMPYETGFMLLYPHPDRKWTISREIGGKKILSTMAEYSRWHDVFGAEDVFTVNRLIGEGKIKEVVNLAEIIHEKKFAEIADDIKNNILTKKVVLITGPSSSGKTTFANRLMLHLKVNGLSPEIISLDDYFKGRSEAVRDEEGNFNFEDLEAIKYELFNEHLTQLVAGEEVIIPRFDFQTGEPERVGRPLKLKNNSVLLVEGIHALNEKISHSLPSSAKHKIYVSALTVMNFDRYNPISPTDTRLIRRIIRDNKYRASNAAETINMWPSVQKGEVKNVFPYEEYADVIFNSSLIYEFNVYKSLAQPLLRRCIEENGNCPKAGRLLELLSYFKSMPLEMVPPMSIIREFVGGSSIKYGK